MTDDRRDEEEVSYYNLDGGQRRLVVQHGQLKAVAPGLRLVEATEEERKAAEASEPEPEDESSDYGLPV